MNLVNENIFQKIDFYGELDFQINYLKDASNYLQLISGIYSEEKAF